MENVKKFEKGCIVATVYADEDVRPVLQIRSRLREGFERNLVRYAVSEMADYFVGLSCVVVELEEL